MIPENGLKQLQEAARASLKAAAEGEETVGPRRLVPEVVRVLRDIATQATGLSAFDLGAIDRAANLLEEFDLAIDGQAVSIRGCDIQCRPDQAGPLLEMAELSDGRQYVKTLDLECYAIRPLEECRRPSGEVVIRGNRFNLEEDVCRALDRVGLAVTSVDAHESMPDFYEYTIRVTEKTRADPGPSEEESRGIKTPTGEIRAGRRIPLPLLGEYGKQIIRETREELARAAAPVCNCGAAKVKDCSHADWCATKIVAGHER